MKKKEFDDKGYTCAKCGRKHQSLRLEKCSCGNNLENEKKRI